MPEQFEQFADETSNTPQFDNQLAGLATMAGGAAQMKTMDAIRKRGAQRAMRHKTVGAVLSVGILGALALGAVQFTQQGDGRRVLPAGQTASNVPASLSSSPAASVSVTAPATPSNSAATVNSPSATSSTSGDPGAPVIPGGDVDTVVRNTWPAVDQLPFHTRYAWSVKGNWLPVQSTQDRQWFYSCRSSDTLSHLGANGYQSLVYKATAHTAETESAEVVQFFFKDDAAAERGLERIQADFTACSGKSYGDMETNETLKNTVTKTASTANGVAYLHTLRRADGTGGSAPDMDSDSHMYFVRSANVVSMVYIGSSATAIDATTQDAATLSDMAARLCAYSGTC
jgi:hypothetical protein